MENRLELPKIKLTPQDLTRNLDEAERALLAADVQLYQMKGTLVHTVRLDHQQIDGDGQVHRESGALNIREAKSGRLLEFFLSAAKFYRFDKRQGAWVPTIPNALFLNTYIARGEWGLRVLTGIIEAPTLRPDGSVLSEPGYDQATGIYLDTGGVEFPEVPESPSRDEAVAALEQLKDIIKDFPFIPDQDADEPGAPCAARSVALSAMLTGVVRKALRTAPAHAVDATSMATGKTLLCDVIAMLATGRAAASISQGQTREELNKRLFSVLLQGDPVVVIDNIDQEVSSDEFCTILTAPEWQNRVLGESETRKVPTNALFLPNGNNIRFKGDMITRVIACRMDARVENPGARRFDRDLRVYVPENRPQLVVAALTVLRAFIVAGRPGATELEPFARFEDWSNLVRGALVWLGEPDPLDTRAAVVAIDPETENLSGLIAAWKRVIGTDRWVTAKDVLDAADLTKDFEDDISSTTARMELDDAIRAIFPRFAPNPMSLGKYLVAFDGRITDGLCIRKHAVKGKSTKFALMAEV